MGLLSHSLEDNIVSTNADWLINWSRKSSVWPFMFGYACCAIEMIGTLLTRYDMARFGAEVARPTPRQSDLFIAAGTVTNKMAVPTKILWDQMPEPKYAIAMGSCACSGGVFDSYAVVQGVDRIIPVDVYIPGCPVRPESLLYGLILLQKKIMKARNLRKLGKTEKRETYIITGPDSYETIEGKPVIPPKRLPESCNKKTCDCPSVR